MTSGHWPVTASETDKVTMEARPVQEVVPDSAQLVKEQTEGSGAVATIYQAIWAGQEDIGSASVLLSRSP